MIRYLYETVSFRMTNILAHVKWAEMSSCAWRVMSRAPQCVIAGCVGTAYAIGMISRRSLIKAEGEV